MNDATSDTSFRTIPISRWPATLKATVFLFTLAVLTGTGVGLAFLAQKSQGQVAGIQENYRGTELEDPMDIPDKYPMPVQQLLVITHTHILSTGMMVFLLGLLVWHTKTPVGLRAVLINMPLFCIFTTYGGIWLVRFIHPGFVWLIVVSGVLMYSTIYAGGVVVIREVFARTKATTTST